VGMKVLVYRPWVDEDVMPGKQHTSWRGPFEVVKRGKFSDRTYHLKTEDNEEFTCDVIDMVPYRELRKPTFDGSEDRCFTHEKPASTETQEDEQGGGVGAEDYYGQTRAVKREILKEVIDTLNACNTRMVIKDSGIAGIDRRYPYGVFTKRAFIADEVLGEYKGGKLTEEELNLKYPADDSRYAFQLRDGTFVDADDPTTGNITRFINGTGEEDQANIKCFEVKGRLTFITIREVAEGEELIYDYGKEYSWVRGERKSLNRDLSRTSTSTKPTVKPIPLDTNEAKETIEEVQESWKLSRPATAPGLLMQRFMPASFDLMQLEQDSCVIYTDKESGDAPDGWSIAMVPAVFENEQLIEAQRLGSQLYTKATSRLADAVWKSRWRDPKDGKDVLTDSPAARLKAHPVVEWIKPEQVIAHGFFLTNRGKIEKTVVDIIQRWHSQET
jgi:hypothetical protein